MVARVCAHEEVCGSARHIDSTNVSGHLLCTCKVERAFVKAAYWSGKQFIPQPGTHAAPYLTFLGTKAFGKVMPVD